MNITEYMTSYDRARIVTLSAQLADELVERQRMVAQIIALKAEAASLRAMLGEPTETDTATKGGEAA